MAGGGAQAVQPGTPLDHVQVDLEDPVLSESGLQEEREDQLLELAREALLTAQEQVLGELLGDGGRAAHGAALSHVGGEGLRQLGEVQAGVGEEGEVFG